MSLGQIADSHHENDDDGLRIIIFLYVPIIIIMLKCFAQLLFLN